MDSRALKDVVIRAQKGDSSAIEQLYTEFYESVYYFAKKTVRDDELAYDITQETFMELIKTIDRLEAPEAFASWIRQITYHQCTRYFKKKKDVLVDEDEDGNSMFDQLEDSETPIPEEVCENEEFRSIILSIVDTLSEEQRSAILMYYYDELPISKIAEIQGVSEGTVKSRLNYARKAVRGGVESYEQKTGTKLHAIPFLPLMRMFFNVPEKMSAAQSAAIGSAVSASAATASAAAAAVATTSGATATTAVASAGITAKLALLPLGAKIAAAVLAVSVTVTAGAVIVSNNDDGKTNTEDTAIESTISDTEYAFDTEALETEPIVTEPIETFDDHPDNNSDGMCDNCSEYLCALYLAPHTTSYADRIYDEICDLCGRSAGGAMGGWMDERPHDDANGDGICDCCNETTCSLPMLSRYGGVDSDGDGICDLCNAYMCDAHGGKVYHTDFDADGLCDSCKHAICAHGYVDHTDENGDRKCDFCYAIVSTPIVDEEETALAETEIIVEETIEEAETETAVDEIATETAETEEAIPDDMVQMIPCCLTAHVAPTLTIENDILTIKNNAWALDEGNHTFCNYEILVNGNRIFIPNERLGMLCNYVRVDDTFSFSLLDYYATTSEGLNVITVQPSCVGNVNNGSVYCTYLDQNGYGGISSTIEYYRDSKVIYIVEETVEE